MASGSSSTSAKRRDTQLTLRSKRRDALVAVDHQVVIPVVWGEDYDDGRLLARLSQRRHQVPLPVRLADS
jgi:hypothetical protein